MKPRKLPFLVLLFIASVCFPSPRVCWGEETGVSPEKVLAQLFVAESTIPPPPGPHDSATDGRLYHYEALVGLKPEDFLGALDYLLDTNPVPSDEATLADYNRAMDYKFRILFAYYPLVARETKDVTVLLDRLYDGRLPDPLRLFLLRHSVPGLEPRSAFGEYLQGHLAYDGEAFIAGLQALVQLPKESVAVQLCALDALRIQTEQDYQNLLANDALVVAQAAGGALPHVRLLIGNPEAIPLSARTQTLLTEKNVAVGRWAASLQALAKNSNRDAALREKARALLTGLLENFPVPNRAVLTKGL